MSRALTLLEILVLVVILGILATLGFPAYRNYVEEQEMADCEQNLQILRTALDMYMMEHDALPDALTLLPRETLDKAYASVMSRPGSWKARFAHFVTEWRHSGFAFAQGTFFLDELARGNVKYLTCPVDENGLPSYGIHGGLLSMSKADYNRLPDDFVLFAECDSDIFDGVTVQTRHKRHRTDSGAGIGILVTRGGTRRLGH